MLNDFSDRRRRVALGRMAEEEFDLLVVGAGITGAGIALDAVSRGLRTALIEKRDFAAGTSSRSTKLIHGGLRYLEHFDFALVREGLQERAILRRIAPHLVEPLPFLIPLYAGRKRNYDYPLKIRAGLWLYDLLARGSGFERHRRLSREEALELAPQLDPEGLRGALLYYDARTEDARLVIEVVKEAASRGVEVANYTRLASLTQSPQGRVSGAQLVDEISGAEIAARARIVINATGVWSDEVRALAGKGAPGIRSVRPSKGIHLLLSKERLRVETAWLIPSLVSHRFYFVVPWEGRVLVGTTDTDYSGDLDAPRASTDEVSEILGAINSYFPAARLEAADVIATFAGLRPLVGGGGGATSDVSREEQIIEEDGLISIAGGKLTTYRRMAAKTVDLAVRRLSESGHADKVGPSRTERIALGEEDSNRPANETAAKTEDAAMAEATAAGLAPDVAEHLAHVYGRGMERVIAIAREDEGLRERMVEDLPIIAAEIVHAARHEMAVKLTDALVRRTRLAILAGRESLACAGRTAALMASELGWSEQETARQIGLYEAEYAREYAPEKC